MGKRGPECQVCTHPTVVEIDAALVAGQISVRQLARRHGVQHGALFRHKERHLPKSLHESEAAIQAVSGHVVHGSVAEEIASYKARAAELGAKAERDKDYRTALLAIRELRGLIETHERIIAARRVESADIAQSQEWRALSAAILTAVAPFPDAHAAMIKAIACHVQHTAKPRTRVEIAARTARESRALAPLLAEESPTPGVHESGEPTPTGRITTHDSLLF